MRNKQKHQDDDWQQLQTLPICQASSEPNSSNLSSSSLTCQSSSSEDSFVLDDDQSLPGPSSPDIITILNILKPLVDELLVMKNSCTVKTQLYPEGWDVYAQLLPLVGDHVAIHKTVGFGSHSAQQSCAWCTAELSNLQGMQVGTKRTGFDICDAAKKWKEAPTLAAQEALRKKMGVCWSELNRLPYHVPHMHIALGVMHNWLEGVLAEHF
ncbi:hypothetical protein O181_107266 [Austropuccinia psidii MF-1]|uniref:Uncharacterized protein n=1 Tax=Austropuccinia psidii MF-1 TaxID=1389203 RepID=A0A9Q3JT13_9BASI|nr:hypothetical protein [Austropuccinia psidii MF-1]